MRLQVEKGMLWAENLLVSSSVRKSIFIAVCPDSIAGVIRQQSLIGEGSDKALKPLDSAAQAINALLWRSDVGPIHHMTDVMVAYQFDGVLALM